MESKKIEIKSNELKLMQDKKTGCIVLVNNDGTGVDLTGKYPGCVTADVESSEMELVPYTGQIVIKGIEI